MNTNEVVQRVDLSNPRKVGTETNLSPDGKWKTFPRVPNLLQYVPSGVFFGRMKNGGKLTRQTLETDVFTTAKLRLGDFIKATRKRAARSVAGTFSDAREQYEADSNADHTLKDGSKLYRRNCIKALLRSWPGLDSLTPAKITETDCRE